MKFNETLIKIKLSRFYILAIGCKDDPEIKYSRKIRNLQQLIKPFTNDTYFSKNHSTSYLTIFTSHFSRFHLNIEKEFNFYIKNKQI